MWKFGGWGMRFKTAYGSTCVFDFAVGSALMLFRMAGPFMATVDDVDSNDEYSSLQTLMLPSCTKTN